MGCTVQGTLQARILEWIAAHFSRGSSQPRDRTQVPHIAGRFFTNWAIRDFISYQKKIFKSHNKGHTFPGIGGGVSLVAKSYPTLATSRTVACQPPLSMGFSKQEYWRGLPVPSPGDLLGPGVESRSPALQGDSLPTEFRGKPFQGSGRPTQEGLRLCSAARNLPAVQEVRVDTDSVPGLKIPRRKKWKLLQHSWRETSMDRWVWWPTVQSVAKSRAWLGNWTQGPEQHAWKRKEDSRGW